MTAVAREQSPTTAAAPPARSSPRGFGAVAAGVAVALPAVAAAVIEAFLLLAYTTAQFDWLRFALAHLLIVALLGAWTWGLSRAGSDCTLALLATLSVAAAGPFGALAALASVALATRRQDDATLLADWYQRIAMAIEADEVTQLCEQVSTGRTSDLTGRAPRSFSAVMERGSLDERQAALGVIARNFHPEYLPVLATALKSPEPVIRVQAAAVATRIRGDLRRLIDRHAVAVDAARPAGTAALAAASELEAAIASGLLDESDRIRAVTIAGRLRESARSAAPRRAMTPVPLLHRQASETVLLAEGRFAELRVGRRIAAVTTAGNYRIRRVRRDAAAEAH